MTFCYCKNTMKHSVYFFMMILLTSFQGSAVTPTVDSVQLPVFVNEAYKGQQTYQLGDVERIHDLNHQIRYLAGRFLGQAIMNIGLNALSKITSGDGAHAGQYQFQESTLPLWHASAGVADKTVTFFYVIVQGVAKVIAIAQHVRPTVYRIIYQVPGHDIVNTGQNDFTL